MRAKNQLNLMEFRNAKKILEDEAKPILKQLIEKYHIYPEGQEADPAKDLVDNRYSFEYRKKYALYLKKFAFYDHSIEILIAILKDEIAYYNIQCVPKPEGVQEQKDDLPQILVEEISVFASEDRYIMKPDTNPYYQVRLSYYQLAKVFVFKLYAAKVSEAIGFAKKITVESQGDEEELFIANCYRLLKEVNLKSYSERNKEAIEEAQRCIERAIDIVGKIVGDGPNYLKARALLGLGDLHLARKQVDEAEKIVLEAQRMVGEIFSDNHPVILEFNQNLVDVYSSKSEESEKLKTLLISEKNLEIAKQFYGPESIFIVRHELALGSNKIGNLQLAEAQANIGNIRKIVQRYHDDNPRDLMNQYLFLGQVLVAITLMSTTSADSADRILTYVMMKQFEYVEGNREHPFLEQTVTNLAILKRTQQDFRYALQLFEQLRRIQEAAYGPDNEAIIYTYKNVGVCYLALGIPERAEEYYLKALNLMSLISDSQGIKDEDALKEDREQLASIYFNLYLSAMSNEDKLKAKEYNAKAMDLNILVHGPNSLQVSNGHFISANLSLRAGDANQAHLDMLEALKIFELEGDVEIKKAKDEMLLIRIRYYMNLGQINYIKGDYPEAYKWMQEGAKIAGDESNYTYETAEDFKKHNREIEAMRYKCEAKIKGVSSLDVKREAAKSKGGESEAEEGSYIPMISCFGLTSATAFALTFAIMRAAANK
ncbi:hypothetical protein FGO68_gene16973 [Halteria grandinella]|uniref:Tetratricopeptide repeat protein n=1 Tax=Halteria grandinella TaxID=5974 RepID=A0A8J8NAP5_HALGN|nr:hypothetical protein FGO68_gene16973 [Halteria grandinella]